MKKGLAVIYDPHNVYQFLWYYCTYGKDIEWSALCLPNSYKGEYLSEPCEKLGIFKNIFRDTQQFDSMPLMKRLIIFIKMFLFALIGKQKFFSKKFIRNFIGDYDFDTAIVLTDVGLVSGLFLTFAPEKEIIILEDGMGDYEARKYSNILRRFKNLFELQGFCLSVLGYSNVGHYYPLRTTKNCIKYCSHPDKMLYKNYKEMKILFDMEKTDVTAFKKYLEIIYPNLSEYFDKKAEVILLTTPISDYISDEKPYVSKIQEYINNNYKGKTILIKKHPRDKATYNFSENITAIEITNSIPAEVLLPYLKDMEILFCDHSSTNLYLTSYGYKPKFLYFIGLSKDNIGQQTMCRYRAKEEFINKLKFFGLGDSQIIEL
jgi:hypothetical protein